jgi:capsule biosynthesis phosphatase
MPKIYVFDLDHTLCVPQKFDDTQRRYAEAEPIPHMIEFVRKLRRRGDTIIIHTARRMLTHRGDLSKIEADVGQVTRDWLHDQNVPYDQLIFGKQFGDVYVDDKAMRPDEVVSIDCSGSF